VTHRILAAAIAALLATPAGAHPHVFVDGGVDFRFDNQRRLAALRVTWIFDPLTSLFMLEDLGIDPSAALDPADRARLAAYNTEWQPGYEGDSYLRDGARQVELSGPLDADAALQDGRIAVTFTRAVEPPFRPQGEAVVEVYDPTYYSEYAVTEAPTLEGNADGCRAEVIPFRPDAQLQTTLDELASVPMEETPADDYGRLFADKVRLACD